MTGSVTPQASSARASDTGEGIAVLCLVGAGRSGSTILERLLAGYTNTVPVGELRHVWERGVQENQLCTCGAPFRDCEFWREVWGDAFGVDEGVAGIRQALRRVDRNRHLLRLHTRMPHSNRFELDLARIDGVYGRLYAAVAAASGVGLIIDSTKDPSHAHLLSELRSIRPVYVHLVRDPRAVAWSHSRPKRRPEIHWEAAAMDLWSPRRAALEWDLKVLLSSWLARRNAERVLRVRYDDLCRDPDHVLARLSTLLARNGMPPLGERLSAPQADRYHTVSGNPIRFDPLGAVHLQADEEWRERMPRRQRALVTALTLPFLLWLAHDQDGER